MSDSMNWQQSLQDENQLDTFVTYQVKDTVSPMLTWLNILLPHLMNTSTL